jgi:malate dehydrogenase
LKATVIGAGNVGASVVQRIAEGGLADVVMTDLVEGMPQGKALDLLEAAPVVGHDSHITGSNSYEEMEGSDVVVITAGLPRKPGMTRLDLLKVNAEIVGDVAKEVKQRCPEAIVIVVTNPLDVMTHHTQRVTGFEPERVLGMAGVLDSARLRAFIAMELGVSVEDVQAMVLGGHGDSMVPLARFSTVSGIGISHLMSQEAIERIVDRTRKAGTEIVALLKTGSAYYAPAASVYQMVEAILNDKKRLLPACVRCTGQYGINGVYVGVPIKLGAGCVEEIIELPLTEEELGSLRKSAAEVEEAIGDLESM